MDDRVHTDRPSRSGQDPVQRMAADVLARQSVAIRGLEQTQEDHGAEIREIKSRETIVHARLSGLEQSQGAIVVALRVQTDTLADVASEVKGLRGELGVWAKSLSEHASSNEEDKRGFALMAAWAWMSLIGIAFTAGAVIYSNWSAISKFIEIRVHLP